MKELVFIALFIILFRFSLLSCSFDKAGKITDEIEPFILLAIRLGN